MGSKSRKNNKNFKNKTRRNIKQMLPTSNMNAGRITPRYSGISALYKSIYGPRRPSALFY